MPRRRPDVGGPELHATAGASAVGARTFLIAYNIYLERQADITVARAIARDIRASNGGHARGEGDGGDGERAGAGEHEYYGLSCDADGAGVCEC